jgi:hypothetical protein
MERICASQKNSEHLILHISDGGVAEADFEREGTICREEQLVPFARQCPCSFSHDSEAVPGKLQRGEEQPPTSFT